MSFDRNLSGYRYADTWMGDTLRRVALRELGDAKYWTDIALINGLRPPYLTDDPSEVTDGVLLTGATLLVPAPQAASALTEDPSEVFGADVLLVNGRFAFENGDLKTVAGIKNLTQAIQNRLSSEKQALLYHPRYGCYTHLLRGRGNGPIASQLAAFYVRSALLEDERVSDVPRCTAQVIGDQIRVSADVVPVAGAQFPLDMVVV